MRPALPAAFVLINAEVGGEEELAKELNGIKNVREVLVVYGVSDLVAKVEADTMEKVKQTIVGRIRSLEKVRLTLSTMVVEEGSPVSTGGKEGSAVE